MIKKDNETNKEEHKEYKVDDIKNLEVIYQLPWEIIIIVTDCDILCKKI